MKCSLNTGVDKCLEEYVKKVRPFKFRRNVMKIQGKCLMIIDLFESLYDLLIIKKKVKFLRFFKYNV